MLLYIHEGNGLLLINIWRNVAAILNSYLQTQFGDWYLLNIPINYTVNVND